MFADDFGALALSEPGLCLITPKEDPVTLLDILKKSGRLELSLKGAGNAGKVSVNVNGAAEDLVMVFEDVTFATGGAITLVHLPELEVV